MTFEAQMFNFANMTEAKAERVFKKTCLDIYSGIVSLTPVDSGMARANWQTGINQFEPGAVTSAKPNNIAALKLGDTFTLTNNLPYIVRLEYGWSKQAPQGMVRVNLMRFNNIVKMNSKGV